MSFLGTDEQFLFEVPRESEEYHYVSALFHAEPSWPSAYGEGTGSWEAIQIDKIERIEKLAMNLQMRSRNGAGDSLSLNEKLNCWC